MKCIKKDKFDPEDKVPKKLYDLFKNFHMDLINLLNSTYILIAVFTFLQFYDIKNLEW